MKLKIETTNKELKMSEKTKEFKKDESKAKTNLEKYWAGSITQSVLNDYKADRVKKVVIKEK